MTRNAASEEALYRLADGLFPLRLEPGKPLLIGREGSSLRIELRVREMQGMNAIIVYDPTGARPTPDALLHALSPLSSLVGEPFEPPSDAPPNARAFRFREEPDDSLVGEEAPPFASAVVAAASPRDGLDVWLDQARLEGLLWAGLEDVRRAGKNARDVIMAVFDAGNLPGRQLMTATYVEGGATPEEATRRVRSSVHATESHGGRLLFHIVDTPEHVRTALETGGILETHGRLLDAALATWPAAGDVPEGHVRAVLFEEATVRPQLVAIRSPGERAAEALEEEKDAILQAVLDRVGEEIRAQHAARRQRGNAAHNLAILVEEVEGGELHALVAMRSDVARAIEAWGSERARPITKALGKSAPAGTTHAVFAMRREGKHVLIHRMTVVQGLGVN